MMGKLIFLPWVVKTPLSRSRLVEDATSLILCDVEEIFRSQGSVVPNLAYWHREIRDYFWRQEIKQVDQKFQEDDLSRWRYHWRTRVLEFIRDQNPR
jgi:hypothetical protein